MGSLAPQAQGAMKTLSFSAPAPSAAMNRAADEAPADDAPAEPAELTAPSNLLAYGELMMPPPSQVGRGRLVRVSRRERYLALAGAPDEKVNGWVTEIRKRLGSEPRAARAPCCSVRLDLHCRLGC